LAVSVEMGGFPAHLDSPMVDGYGKLLTNGLRYFHKRLSMIEPLPFGLCTDKGEYDSRLSPLLAG
jgi:hypothetical protein